MVHAYLRFALLAVGLLTCAPVPAVAQPGTASDDGALLQALELELAQTLRTKDRADMERLLADAFTLRATPDVNREAWIREALARCWGGRFEIDEFTARVDGLTAVASFVLTSYVNPETCATATMRSLITDVWWRDGETWRLGLRHSSAAGSGVAAQFAVVPPPPSRWVLLSEVSFVSTTGNTSTTTTGLASELTRQTDASSSRMRFAFVSTAADEVTQARATTVQARHGFRVRQHLEIFGRAAYARDRFAGIDNRSVIDAGVALTTGRAPRHQLTFESGVGYTAEDRVATDILRFATATGTARYVWQMATGTEFREELAIISDLSEGRNWRVANAAVISIALTRLLSLKVSNDVEYRNLPVFGFQRTDTRTAAAIALAFRGR